MVAEEKDGVLEEDFTGSGSTSDDGEDRGAWKWFEQSGVMGSVLEK